MEFKTKLDTIQVDFNCPKCHTGVLRQTGTLYGNPTKYPHKCTNCDYTETFLVVYPYLKNEPAAAVIVPPVITDPGDLRITELNA